MKTVTEHIREHIYRDCFAPRIDYRELTQTEWSDEFERYMRNRLLMGAFRYARLHDPETPQWNTIASIISRAERYLQDGNQEHLVDIANLALVEFCRPSCHPNPRFAPADDGYHAERM